MNVPTIDNIDRGQVGIGTLIIFIALVLVAAVAAGVLINTSGELQSRASDTGDDAQAEVSNQIDVVSATGVDNATDDTVDTVQLVVKKSPGSDAIDLGNATIQYTSNQNSATLSYAATASATEFSTETINSGPAQIIEHNGQRVRVVIDVETIEGSGLGAGDNARLELVDQSGATTVYGVNVPDVLSGQYFPL